MHSSLRPLRRRPGTSLLGILVLALGFGTTLTVLAIAEAVLVRDLPVEEPERLVYVASERLETGGLFGVRLHEALAWRRSVRSFAGLSIMHRAPVHLRLSDRTERLEGVAVEPAYFEVLGFRPALGRVLTSSDLEGEPAVLLSHELWQQRFGGAKEVIGRSIELNGTQHVVVGVMHPGPRSGFLGWLDVWTTLDPDEAAAETRQMWGFSVLARLRESAHLASARRELDQAAARLARERPEWNEGWGAEARPVREWMSEDVETPLRLLLLAAILVWLVACVTTANLLYATTAGRRREMAVRGALGASRRHLVGHLLKESTVLSIVAAGLGLVLAVFAGRATLAWLPAELLSLDRLALGWRTWITAAVATVLASFFCTGIAALALHRSHSLAATANPQGGGRHVRGGLVTLETALATVALLGSVLLVESLANVRDVNPGFDPQDLLTFRLELPADSLPEKTLRVATLRRLEDGIAALPGVESVALAGFGLPLTGEVGVFQVWIEGRPRGPQPDVITHAQAVSPGYFETLGIQRIEGRSFTAAETWESLRSLVVNRAFVDSYFPTGDAIGRYVDFANGERGTIVGVVENVRQIALDRPPAPEIYLAWGTAPDQQALLVRTTEAPPSAEVVRRRIGQVLPDTPVYEARTGEELLRSSYATRTVTTWTLSVFAAMAQVLGLVGLYGLVLFWVSSRRRDLGIRAAIGARPVDLALWALGFGLRPVGVGIALGLLAAFAGSRLLESQLFGVRPSDPTTLAFAVSLVLTTALLTSWVPARRAAKVDPATVLRAE